MSRGLGKIQRAILNILQDGQWHWIDDMADIIYAEQWDMFCNETHYFGQGIDRLYSYDWATIRAAKNLQAKGLIEFESIGRNRAIMMRNNGKRAREGFSRRAKLQQKLLSVGHKTQHLESEVKL